jgi:hypothetical protein
MRMDCEGTIQYDVRAGTSRAFGTCISGNYMFGGMTGPGTADFVVQSGRARVTLE